MAALFCTIVVVTQGCAFGVFYEGCPDDFDEAAGETMAEQRGVIDVWARLDVVCQPRSDVVIDCRNPAAETCTVRIGSAVHRARVVLSSDSDEGVMPLLEHEMAAHFGGGVDPADACAQHPPKCDGLPD